MINEFCKTPVFLIDLGRDEDYALFLDELGDESLGAPKKKLSGHNFIPGQAMMRDERQRFLCITLFGPWMFWSGNNESRPLGNFTPDYVPINGRAYSIKHYLEIFDSLEKEDDLPKARECWYHVKMDDNVREILAGDKFEGGHRPWFQMKNSTHSVYTINPFLQKYSDAAYLDDETISADEFVAIYNSCFKPCSPTDFCGGKKCPDDGEQK